MASRWRLLGLAVASSTALAAVTVSAAWWPSAPAPADGDLVLVVDPATLARVDLQAVHEEYVPDWVAATGGVRSLHLERLRRAVSPDATLLDLLDRIARRDDDPAQNVGEIHALVRAWNQVLAKGGSPYRLGAEVVVGSGGGRLVLKSYRAVLGEPAVELAGERFPVEIRRRVDPLATQDAWLGRMHDHDDGIVILLDRVTTFALDEVWPMLDPETQLSPLQQAHAVGVRAELARHLDPAELDVLANTASDRVLLMRSTAAVHHRHACGSSFVISRLPWNGFDARDLTVFQRHAEGGGTCPEVTPDEAMAFAARSWHLQHTEGVREALEHLVAVVAAGVAVHEARHAADDRALDGQRIACIGCPPGTSHLGALEGSAYASTFADPDHGAVAFFQACRVANEAGDDVHDIVEFLAGQMGPGGCSAPPAGLAAAAASVERDVFLRSDQARLVGFPTGLPVSSEFRGR